MSKAHVRHGDLAFCGSCYKKEFKRVSCSGCGNGTYAYHGETPAYCKQCRIKDRVCSGCGKPLPRASKIIENKAYCWPCTVKLRTPEPCALCGQASLALSKAPSLGIYQRICERCRTKRTHFTCNSCGKYRKPAGLNKDGMVVCKRCLELENYRCPQCGEPGIPHSKKRCQSCYWKDHAQAIIANGVVVLSPMSLT